jgi:hypothetical protein
MSESITSTTNALLEPVELTDVEIDIVSGGIGLNGVACQVAEQLFREGKLDRSLPGCTVG